MNDFIYRQHIQHSDIGAIADIVKSSGFFSAEEIDIALELAEEKLTQPMTALTSFYLPKMENALSDIPASALSLQLPAATIYIGLLLMKN